jgi:hypothetical protein
MQTSGPEIEMGSFQEAQQNKYLSSFEDGSRSSLGNVVFSRLIGSACYCSRNFLKYLSIKLIEI